MLLTPTFASVAAQQGLTKFVGLGETYRLLGRRYPLMVVGDSASFQPKAKSENRAASWLFQH